MAWIEVHQSIVRHRKTLAFASCLGISRVQAIGYLVTLWLWALDNAEDGKLPDSPKVIAFGAEWPRQPERFVAALVESGFVDQMPDGSLQIHDWDDYAGRLIAKRASNRERMRSARATHVQRTERARAAHVQGLPNHTKPNHTKPNQPDQTITSSSATLRDKQDGAEPQGDTSAAAAEAEDTDFRVLQERWERRTGKPVSASAALELTALLRDFGLATVQRAWKLADMNGTRWASPRYLRPICEQIAEQQERAPPEYEPGRGYPGGRYSHLFQQGAAGDGGADDG